MMIPSPYLDSARQGRSAWWTYLLGLGLILFAWLIVGSVLTVIGLLLFHAFGGQAAMGNLGNSVNLLSAMPAEQAFVITNISFVPFLLAIVLVVWLVHGRSPKTLITPFTRINWGRMALSFGIWLALAALSSLVEFLIWPETFRLSFAPGRYLAFLALPLLFTPIQIATEELFFRGYLLQAMGLVIRRRVVIIVLSGLLFFLPHLANPELYLGENAVSNFVFTALAYLFMGALLTWATLADQTLEVALGVHAANNLYVGLLVNFEGSALPTPAVVMTSHYDAVFNLVMLLVSAAIFAAIVFGVARHKPSDAPAQ